MQHKNHVAHRRHNYSGTEMANFDDKAIQHVIDSDKYNDETKGYAKGIMNRRILQRTPK